MKLTEITKGEFVDKLKDPALFSLKELVEQAKSRLAGWTLSYNIEDDGLATILSFHEDAYDLTKKIGAKAHEDMEGMIGTLVQQNKYWRLANIVSGWEASGKLKLHGFKLERT